MYQRKAFYNLIVLIVMLAFALFNVSTQIAEYIGVAGVDGRVFYFVAALSAGAIPLLIAALGGQFLDNAKCVTTSKLCRTWVPRMALSCLFWWMIMALLYMKAEYPSDLDVDTFFECLATVLENPYCARIYHLVFMMVLLYPLLKRIADSLRAMQYIIIVSFCLCVLNPLIGQLPYISYINLFTDQINWQFFSVYALFLFLGVYINRQELELHWRIVIYCLGGLSTAAMYMLTVIYSASLNIFDDEWLNENSIFVFLQSLAVLVLLNQLSKKCATQRRIEGILNEVGRYGYTFAAVYTISETLISQVLTFEDASAPLTMMLKYTTCLVICGIIEFGMKRIPILFYLSKSPGEL